MTTAQYLAYLGTLDEEHGGQDEELDNLIDQNQQLAQALQVKLVALAIE